MSDLIERFSRACGEPITSVDSWVDEDGRVAIKVMSGAGVEHTVRGDSPLSMDEAMDGIAEWFKDRRESRARE